MEIPNLTFALTPDGIHAAHLETATEIVNSLTGAIDFFYENRNHPELKRTDPITPLQAELGHDPNIPYENRAFISKAAEPAIRYFELLLESADNFLTDVTKVVVSSEEQFFSSFGVARRPTFLTSTDRNAGSPLVTYANKLKHTRGHFETSKRFFPPSMNLIENFIGYQRNKPTVSQSQLP